MKGKHPISVVAGVIVYLGWICVASAASGILVKVSNETIGTGATQYIADVTINDKAGTLRGMELNIGFDSGLLAFNKGEAVDGDWAMHRIDAVTVDDTNKQTGQLKVLLAGRGTGGTAANTEAILARLTFDVKNPPTGPQDSGLVFLKSSAGLRDTDISAVKFTAVKGDANEDLEVTAQDAVDAFWLSFEASWSDAERFALDLNDDAEVSAQDAVDVFWLSF